MIAILDGRHKPHLTLQRAGTLRMGCAKLAVSKTTELSGFRSIGTPPPTEWRCSE
jgi:hypothetical protein